MKNYVRVVVVDKLFTRAHCSSMFITTLQVALGGAIGAALRFLTGIGILRLMGPGFPVAVMGINIFGSFVMGLFVVFATQRGVTQLNSFMMVGLLGGFTSFSAFSFEAVSLFERGAMGQALAYVVMSVVLSIGSLLLGLMIARGIWV